jgi:hypothetical protein
MGNNINSARVISEIKTTPVRGERTTAVKKAAIPTKAAPDTETPE